MNSLDGSKKNIVVLGAGITGLMVAWELSKKYHDRVVLIEKENHVGGLASTLTENGISFDLGSHRIHEQYYPEAFRVIKELLGSDLLKQPRLGILVIKDHVLKYPPSFFQVCFAFGSKQLFYFVCDYLRSFFVRLFIGTAKCEDYESYSIRHIGKSLYEVCYKPYALKLWSLSPSEISFEPAMNRMKKFTVRMLWNEVLAWLMKAGYAPYFYYPKKGIGQLSERIKELFLENGGRLFVSSEIKRVILNGENRIQKIEVRTETAQTEDINTDLLISTIPIDTLYGLCGLNDSENNRFSSNWRNLRIICLLVPGTTQHANETFYLPEPKYLMGRVSEIAKYSPYLNAPGPLTLLTVEIPCSAGDDVWLSDETSLATNCMEELIKLKIVRPNSLKPHGVFSRKLEKVYPVYKKGWKRDFGKIYRSLDNITNLYQIGRSALFLHSNIDHGIMMAKKLADFLINTDRDKKEWNKIAESFFAYKVRD